MERKRGQMNRKTVRLQEYDYNTAGVYFLTLCTEKRRCILSRIVGTGVLDGPQIELLPVGAIADKYLRQLNDFYENLSVESYVIMPNHMHLLLQVKEGPSRTPVPTLQNSTVSRFVSTFKRFCNREYGTNVWQRGAYDHIIRDQADFDKHIQYIYENPFGWQKDEYYSAE
ncbi:MAG: transposase [Oscillospiraceae bacterium]|nr:transposase [Oscillospiraceae bacterium]